MKSYLSSLRPGDEVWYTGSRQPARRVTVEKVARKYIHFKLYDRTCMADKVTGRVKDGYNDWIKTDYMIQQDQERAEIIKDIRPVTNKLSMGSFSQWDNDELRQLRVLFMRLGKL